MQGAPNESPDHEDVEALLPIDEAIDVIDRTMRTVSAGGAELPLRSAVPVGGHNTMGVMPGALSDPPCFAVKLVSLFPANPARGLSGHRGAMLLFEPETGGAVAIMDAGLLTAIRTAAATRLRSRAESRILALIGTGEQAEHHLEAMIVVRPLTELRVVGRRAEKAAAFAARAAARHRGLTVMHGTDARAAVRGADLVCTVTNSDTPELLGDWLEPGQHLNVVGASIPSKREVDDAVVQRAAVFCDYRPSFFAPAGEIVEMVEAGALERDHLRGEIGEALRGAVPSRRGSAEITLYRSLGIPAQDLAAAHHVLAVAEASGRWQSVRF